MLDTNLCHNTTSRPTRQQRSRLTPAGQRNATRVPPHVAEVCPHRNPENPVTPTLLKPPPVRQRMPISSTTGDATLVPQQLCLTPGFRPRQLSDESLRLARPASTHSERQDNKVSSAVRTNQPQDKFSPCVGELIRRPLHPAQPFAWPTRQPAGH